MTATTAGAGVNAGDLAAKDTPKAGNPEPAGVPAPAPDLLLDIAPAPRVAPIVVIAYGTPVTQGSIRSLGAGRPSIHGNAKRLKPWRSAVTEAALEVMQLADRLTGPVHVDATFYFDRPSGHYRSGRNGHLLRDWAPPWPATRNSGDLDKLVRAGLDALVDAGVMTDDSLVVALTTRKVWAGEHDDALAIPGARLEIRPVRA